MADNFTLSDGVWHDTLEYLCDEIFDFTTINGFFFILIFIFSITGNGLLLCVLVFYENLKNATNLFIFNLICSDLAFTLTLPFWAIYYLHHWVFGDFFCKFVTAAYFVGVYSSVILLTAMTVDRFITVVLYNWSSTWLTRQRYTIGACAGAWVISIAASLSNAINVQVETNMDNITTCEASIDSHGDRVGYYLQVTLLFFLPFAIIVFCYSAILKTVLQASNRRRYRTVVVILCIVSAFFICWGPYNMFLFIENFYEPQSCKAEERMETAYNVCRILAFSHCCMNPLLYVLSQKLRKHLSDLLSCKNVKRRHMERETGQNNSGFQNAMELSANAFK
uniref:chemokine XC receptor 1-like n=1 Tax=Monopterus albus TaxID=43700 RepID=UPI0009B4E0C3|nr:chemokine XC receptor 1-like [Monopterus albus]